MSIRRKRPADSVLSGLGKVVHGNDAADVGEVRRTVSAGADRLSTNDVAMAIAIREEAAAGP
ncbi:MAG: hypothetical protein ACKPDI_12110 [Actinomycetota bacterium]